MTVADALSAHDRALTFGGRAGILRIEAVEAAIGRPFSGYYRRINKKAAALVESLALNHGFVDGNKRTTLILTGLLIERSGYRLQPLPGDASLQDAVERMILDVVNKALTFQKLCAWFAARIV